MTTYLKHPQHGYHVLSYGDNEPEMIKAGWSRCAHPNEGERDAVQEEAPAEEVKPRRGRKPKAQ